MDVCEPRPRHRGFFLHSSEGGEPDTGEHENPEGFVVRVRFGRADLPRHSFSGGRHSHPGTDSRSVAAEGLPAIRSGSVTGSRQLAHMSR